MKKTVGVSLLILIVSLGLFMGMSKFVQRGKLKQMDFAATVRIQGKMPIIERLGGDEVWEDLTFFVSPPASVVWLLSVTCGLALLQIRHIRSQKNKQWWMLGIVLCIPLLFAFLVGIELYGKQVIRQLPPPHFMLKNPSTIFPKYYVSDEYSYPSGHAGRVMFLSFITFLLALFLPKNKKRYGFGITGFILFMYSMAVSIGKVYLGHHWLSDILAGWVLGGGFGGSIVWIVYQQTKNHIDTHRAKQVE